MRPKVALHGGAIGPGADGAGAGAGALCRHPLRLCPGSGVDRRGLPGLGLGRRSGIGGGAVALREGTEPLVLAPPLREPLSQAEPCLRRTVLAGAARGIPLPALGAALLYYDQNRTPRMSVNLVQALRDCFGAHTYERIDRPGTFHTEWES